MKRLMIMAGGTGGHVFPALAVADVVSQQGVEVSWIGTARGIEAKLVPEAGYPLNNISVQGLRGNGAMGWLKAPFKLVKAVLEAMAVIREFNPDVVIGLGGFASGPGGVAAWLLRKPMVIHEQNAIPGLTNRLLSHIAKRVLEGFPNSFSPSRKAEWVGNPVRASIEEIASPEQRFDSHKTQANILVLGGSLGARTLNTVVPEALALLPLDKRPIVRHQCGPKHLDDCIASYKQAGVHAEISAFVADMAAAYEWADIVICRAGALTLAEISTAGIASILVPYPFAVDDHQTHNASALVMAGAAIIIQDNELRASDLSEQLSNFLMNKQTLLTMATAARTQAKPKSAQAIAAICNEVCHG